MLVVRGATTTFNPTFDQATVDKAIESDPPRYQAEYNSIWRDDLQTFLSRDLLDAAVDVGVRVRSPLNGVSYFAFGDPSGGVSDSFTMAISHREGERIVLDLIYERRPPMNPSEVVAEIAALLKGYRITTITGDRYAAQWVVTAFAKHGIRYIASDLDRSEVYLGFLPLITAGQARLIDHPRSIAQFAALERRTFPTGKDRVDHGKSGHDDVANSIAGALVLAASRKARFIVTDAMLARFRQSGAPMKVFF